MLNDGGELGGDVGGSLFGELREERELFVLLVGSVVEFVVVSVAFGLLLLLLLLLFVCGAVFDLGHRRDGDALRTAAAT